MYPTYPLMECVSSLKNEVDDTVPKESTIDMFLKTICEKNGANVLRNVSVVGYFGTVSSTSFFKEETNSIKG